MGPRLRGDDSLPKGKRRPQLFGATRAMASGPVTIDLADPVVEESAGPALRRAMDIGKGQ